MDANKTSGSTDLRWWSQSRFRESQPLRHCIFWAEHFVKPFRRCAQSIPIGWPSRFAWGTPRQFKSEYQRLADGNEVTIMSDSCSIDWFGATEYFEAIANNGELPLLGIGMLTGHRLFVD